MSKRALLGIAAAILAVAGIGAATFASLSGDERSDLVAALGGWDDEDAPSSARSDAATEPSPPRASSASTSSAATDGSSPAAAPGASTPELAVQALYDALDKGDDTALDAALSSVVRVGTDVASFPAWRTPVWEVLGVEGVAPGYAVYVREDRPGIAGGVVTFEVVNEDGWRVAGWAAASESAPTMPESSLSPAEARTAVTALLDSVVDADPDAARAATTSRFQEAEPGYFSAKPRSLAGYEITNVFPDGARYVVQVEEDWRTRPERVRYIVVASDGRALVDQLVLDFE